MNCPKCGCGTYAVHASTCTVLLGVTKNVLGDKVYVEWSTNRSIDYVVEMPINMWNGYLEAQALIKRFESMANERGERKTVYADYVAAIEAENKS